MNGRIRRSHALLLGVTIVMSSGCRPDQGGDFDWTGGQAPRPGSEADWALITQEQARRLDSLSSFSSDGSIIIDRRDDQGNPITDRLNHRLWRVAPDKAALRLSIGGITGGRLGWNGPRWWMLDEGPDRPELMVVDLRDPESIATWQDEELMSPPGLMAMAGLMPFPKEPPSDFMIAGDRVRFTLDSISWTSEEGGLKALNPLGIVIGAPRNGPIRIEGLDGEGNPSTVVELERFEPVETLGKPPGAWPDLPTRIVVAPRGEDVQRLVITFDGALAQGRISDRLFSLDALIERVDPVLLDGRAPSPGNLLETKGDS